MVNLSIRKDHSKPVLSIWYYSVHEVSKRSQTKNYSDCDKKFHISFHSREL